MLVRQQMLSALGMENNNDVPRTATPIKCTTNFSEPATVTTNTISNVNAVEAVDAVDVDLKVEIEAATITTTSTTTATATSNTGLKNNISVFDIKEHEADDQREKQFNKNKNLDTISNNVPQNFNNDMNNAVNTNTNCPFVNHHYHYIDYPAAYYQRKRQLNLNATQNDNVGADVSFGPNAYHYCACSCTCDGQMQITPKSLTQKQQHLKQRQQKQNESQMAVSAIVHCPSSVDADRNFQTHSELSLQSHSYQMLNVLNENKSTSSCRSKLNINSDLECRCASAIDSIHQQPLHPQHHNPKLTLKEQKQQQQQQLNKKGKNFRRTLSDSILANADEITVSESDNNGTLTKRKNTHQSRVHKKINSWYEKNYNCNHIEIYSDGDDDDDGNVNGNGLHGGDGDELDTNHLNVSNFADNRTGNMFDQRPPLPPRPQPPSSTYNQNSNSTHRPGTHSIKKYVIWCLICGGFSCLLGALFLGVYFLLHSYTITVGNFETVPTFVPATLLILTGVCIMSLARRRNRYSYLIKLSGACGLISALTCALVTVTTTVLHMSRLQALRECEYAQKTRTCTCYSDMIESQLDRVDKEGVRLVFDSLSDCGVVHGSLYSCLRAIFGLSVAGVLTSVFSCMLVYQLLSHERKKMYWEQLELRCRSLYTNHQQQHQASGAATHSITAGIGTRNASICRCCEQCHAHRQMQLQTASYPWIDELGEPRFWAGQPPGNFYSPNPCGGNDENNAHNHVTATNRSRLTGGWSWPRMPWQRNGSGARFRQVPSSPDSQYGFSSNNATMGMPIANTNGHQMPTTVVDENATAAAMTAVVAATATQRASQAFNIAANANALPYGVWGPPPPYSDPNSPARRGFYQYIQNPNDICNISVGNIVGVNEEMLQHRPLSANALNTFTMDAEIRNASHNCVPQRTFEHISQRICATQQIENALKAKEQHVETSLSKEYGNTCSDSDVDGATNRHGDRFSNTLPTRKMKKRVIDGTGSIAKCVALSTRQQLATHRINVQRVFPTLSNSASENDGDANARQTTALTSVNKSNCVSKDNRACSQAAFDNDTSNNMNLNINNNNHMLKNITITEHIQCDGIENNAFLNNSDGCDLNNASNSNFNSNSNLNSNLNNDTTINSDIVYEDPTESEIYFADVSSCCNMSMKNDHCYDDEKKNVKQNQLHVTSNVSAAKRSHLQHPQHQYQRNNCSQSNNASCCNTKVERSSFEQRENSLRGRQARTPICQDENYTKERNGPTTRSIERHMEESNNDMIMRLDNKNYSEMLKDNSMHSMCSIESEARTECTDLSPSTPCSFLVSSGPQLFQCHNPNANVTNAGGLTKFISSFPYASEAKFHEAHRRLTKTMHENLLTTNVMTSSNAGDPHYEIVNSNDDELNLSKEFTSSAMSPHPQHRSQRTRNFISNCNLNKGPSGRDVQVGRNIKSKDHLPSDTGASNSHRQRL